MSVNEDYYNRLYNATEYTRLHSCTIDLYGYISNGTRAMFRCRNRDKGIVYFIKIGMYTLHYSAIECNYEGDQTRYLFRRHTGGNWTQRQKDRILDMTTGDELREFCHFVESIVAYISVNARLVPCTFVVEHTQFTNEIIFDKPFEVRY